LVAVRRWGAWTFLGGAGVRVFFAIGLAMLARGLTGAPQPVSVLASDPESRKVFRIWRFFVAFFAAIADTRGRSPSKEAAMSWLDKLLGRGKQAAGDVTGDSSMKHEGMHQEQEGMASERAEQAEDAAQQERERAAEHHAERQDG
jgi:uncharacterized protein YjbJ (UPF0337 family)